MPRTYMREISDAEMELFDAYGIDPVEWLNAALDGKIHSMEKRLIRGEIERDDPKDDRPLWSRKNLIKKGIQRKKEERKHGRTEITLPVSPRNEGHTAGPVSGQPGGSSKVR